jgi:hypothetical protein
MNHCPQHSKLKLVEFPIRVGKANRAAWACPVPTCNFISVVPPARSLNPQRRLGIMPRERQQVVLQERESGVSQRIEDRFRLHGYEVLVTSEHRRKIECPKCKAWFTPSTGSGVDKGVPDQLVRDPRRYPPYLWIGVEVKGPKTPISDEQKIFGARLGYVIARSDDEAWDSVMWAESILLSAIEAWREECVTILLARQDAQENGPVWAAARLEWLRSERAAVWQIGKQTLAILDAEIKSLQGPESI